jgi:hypothetical protein
MRAGGKIRGHAASRQAKLEPIYDAVGPALLSQAGQAQ